MQITKQTCRNSCIFYCKISTHDPDKGMVCSLGNKIKCVMDKEPCFEYTQDAKLMEEDDAI